jgi:hypothetical protein
MESAKNLSGGIREFAVWEGSPWDRVILGGSPEGRSEKHTGVGCFWKSKRVKTLVEGVCVVGIGGSFGDLWSQSLGMESSMK